MGYPAVKEKDADLKASSDSNDEIVRCVMTRLEEAGGFISKPAGSAIGCWRGYHDAHLPD